VEQDRETEGVARSQHVVHVLPADDRRIAGIVRTQVERLAAITEEGGVRLLVLTPTAGEAAALAREVNDGLDASGALLTPLTTETRGARRVALGSPCLAAPADLALALLKRSLLKLERIETVVLVSLDALATGSKDAIEAILTEAPRGADRVATTAELNPVIDSILERHARKARRVQHDLPSPAAAVMEYVVCDEHSRTDVLGRLFDSIDPPHATVISSEDNAEEACAALARLGYGPDDELVEFSDGETPENEALVVLFGAPEGPDDLTSILEATPQRVVVLVAPHEVTAFLRVFGARARPTPASALVEIAGSMEDALRGEIRGVIGSTPVHREVLALSPLFAERDPVEVAAALLRMYEQARADAQVGAATPHIRVVSARVEPERESREPSARREEHAPRARRDERSDEGSFSAIYINVGSRDGAQKGDLVGAIAGESGISSDQIGRITLRDTFSIVEIASGAAEQVLASINGKTIRGRIISARHDRMVDERPARGRPERTEGRSFDRPREGGARGRPSTGRGAMGGRGGAGGARPGARGAGSRPAGGPRRGSRDDAGAPRRGSRDDVGGPRTFRDNDRNRAPKAIRESREWGERGERLRNARRPRRERDE
jgi:ATP-dependent RNA helicase DeaD